MITMHCRYPDDRHYWISQNCSKMLSVGIPHKNILRCKTERATGVDWTSGHVDVDMKTLDIQPPLSLRRVSPVRPRALSDGSRRMLGMLPAPACLGCLAFSGKGAGYANSHAGMLDLEKRIDSSALPGSGKDSRDPIKRVPPATLGGDQTPK